MPALDDYQRPAPLWLALAHQVARTPGTSTSELAQLVGSDTSNVLKRLRFMERDGTARSTSAIEHGSKTVRWWLTPLGFDMYREARTAAASALGLVMTLPPPQPDD